MIIDKELVQEAKENLGDKAFYVMMEELEIEDYDEKNLKCRCPFHEEKTASFIWNQKTNSAHCFGACHRNYDILDIYMSKGYTYLEAVQKLFELTGVTYSFGEKGVKTKYQYRYPKEETNLSKDRVYKYLKSRKISQRTVDYLDIREDSKGNAVFNYYDLNDTLTMVKYRPSRKVKKGESKNWCQKGADTAPVLYNMNRINTTQPLIIACGEIDCAALIECGIKNTVSIPLGDGNTHWIEENWEWLEEFNEIVICPDNDLSGQKFCKDVIHRLGSWRCKIANVPEIAVIDDNEIRIKDINEYLYFNNKDKVIEVIQNASDTPVQSVVDFSDITDKDLDTIDGISTGFAEIDKELMRLFYSTLTILSGVPGAGKTSWLSQLICNTLDQDKNCWLFSRELPDWMSKNWINYIFAGRHNINEFTNKNGAKYYKVKQEAKAQIDKYYKGRLYIYKDDFDTDIDALLQSMTDVVRKYGVKLLVIDNMMMIEMNANEKNQNQKETEIIKKLIDFSMKYNVAVVLVAHPRKLQAGAELGLYDISGSANIQNLAHRTISLRRVTPKEKEGKQIWNGRVKEVSPNKYDVMVTVIKDRLRGKQNMEFGLFYDNPTRRFFSNEKEFNHQYLWDKKKHNTKTPYPISDEVSEVFGEVNT